MREAKEEWVEEHIERGMMSENSKEANNTLKALTKTQQHESAVMEDSCRNTLMEGTAVLNCRPECCSGL